MVKEGYQNQTVAPVPYVNKTLSEYRYLGDASVGILPEYLLEAGFQPVESAAGNDLDSLLTELKYGQSDRVNPATAAQIGEQLGAKYVFLGEVNSYRVVKPKGSRSINVLGFGVGLGGGKITYDLQVSGRLVNVSTRAIVAAKTVSHKETFSVEGGNIRTPYGSFNQSQSVEVENEVGGKVLAHALSRLVTFIVKQLNSRPVR
jgi:curli biogenesis system outer membrane secretion channel CsgG